MPTATQKASRTQPPTLMDVLSDGRLSPMAKVVYTAIDTMGQGRPVVIQQQELADLLAVSRKTVNTVVAMLHRYQFIEISYTVTDTGARGNTYKTRVVPQQVVHY